MATPNEFEYRCPADGSLIWKTDDEARSFAITCWCGKKMRKTGQRKEHGELVVPEPPKVQPTMIPAGPQVKLIDKPDATG